MLISSVGLITWGFVVGARARLALPGPDPMPWYATIGLGLGGSLIGGVIPPIPLGPAGGPFFALPGATPPPYPFRRFPPGRGRTGPSTRPPPPPPRIASPPSSRPHP